MNWDGRNVNWLHLDGGRRPMASRRVRRHRPTRDTLDAIETLILLIFHVALLGGALGSVLLVLWLTAPGGGQ